MVACSIEWNKDTCFVYPIPPVKPLVQPDMRQALYEMYKDPAQPFCDWRLVSQDGEAIKVNGTVLAVYGGAVFKTPMACTLKEANEKSIAFPDASLELVEQFVEFLYRGPAALDPENFRGKEINIYALLQLGHRWEVAGLVDCCTNFISATCSSDQFTTIWNLAGVYENVHLAELCLHWLKQKQAPLTAAASITDSVNDESMPPLEDDLYGDIERID